MFLLQKKYAVLNMYAWTNNEKWNVTSLKSELNDKVMKSYFV